MDSRKFAFYLLSSWIFISSLFFTSSAYLRTYYWEELCGNTFITPLYLQNGQSGILALYNPGYSAGACTIRLVPRTGSSVVLSIYKFHLSSVEELTITLSDDFKVALLGENVFPDERKSFISEGEMVIRYSWNNTESMESNLKFQFVFTHVTNGPCRFDEFQCRNKKCVSKTLLCDRHNHCGDNSDQESCGNDNIAKKIIYKEKITYTSPVWIIIMIACSVLLAIIIIVFIVLIIRSNIRRKKQLASKAVSQTVASNSLPLTTVATSIPPNPSAPPASEAPPTLFARFRQSLRGIRSSATAPPAVEQKPDNYQVPSMYPQISSDAHSAGVQNPEFKGDEA